MPPPVLAVDGDLAPRPPRPRATGPAGHPPMRPDEAHRRGGVPPVRGPTPGPPGTRRAGAHAGTGRRAAHRRGDRRSGARGADHRQRAGHRLPSRSRHEEELDQVGHRSSDGRLPATSTPMLDRRPGHGGRHPHRHRNGRTAQHEAEHDRHGHAEVASGARIDCHRPSGRTSVGPAGPTRRSGAPGRHHHEHDARHDRTFGHETDRTRRTISHAPKASSRRPAATHTGPNADAT